MRFQSHLALEPKVNRAFLLLLALSHTLAEAGERVGVPGITRPFATRSAPRQIAQTLTHHRPQSPLPEVQQIERFSELIVISDFLDPLEDISKWLRNAAATGARGHLIQVLDPIEEAFPFVGPTEFIDPETNQLVNAGRAQQWKDEYLIALKRQKDTVQSLCQQAGWSYTFHHTDHPPTEPLLSLHQNLTAAGAGFNRGGLR